MPYETYGAYTILSALSVSPDGRVGRCWFHVYPSQEMAERDSSRLFSYRLAVGWDVLRLTGRDDPLDAVALEKGREWLHEMLARQLFEPGKTYRDILTVRNGIVIRQDSVEELDGAMDE